MGISFISDAQRKVLRLAELKVGDTFIHDGEHRILTNSGPSIGSVGTTFCTCSLMTGHIDWIDGQQEVKKTNYRAHYTIED